MGSQLARARGLAEKWREHGPGLLNRGVAAGPLAHDQFLAGTSGGHVKEAEVLGLQELQLSTFQFGPIRGMGQRLTGTADAQRALTWPLCARS